VFFKLNNEFEHIPCLAHELYAYFVVNIASRYTHGPKGSCPRLRGPEASGPVVFVVKTTETAVKACAKRVWLNGCSKVFKRSRTQTGKWPAILAPASSWFQEYKTEPSIQLIHTLRIHITLATMSEMIMGVMHSRLPSKLPVKKQINQGLSVRCYP